MSSIPPPVPGSTGPRLDCPEQDLDTEEMEISELSHDVHHLATQLGNTLAKVQEALGALEDPQARAECERSLAEVALPADGAAGLKQQIVDIRVLAIEQRRRLNRETRTQLMQLASMVEKSGSELQSVHDRVKEYQQSTRQAEQKKQEAPVPPVAAPQRRTHTRHPIHAAVTFESENNFYTGFSQDLGAGGLFVATVDVLPQGSKIELTIAMPDGSLVPVSGEVRWTREYNEQTPHVYPGMGIQFVGLTPEAQNLVASFIQQRESLFYED